MIYVERATNGEQRSYIDLEDVDLDGQSLIIEDVEGYGGCDVQIFDSILTWAQVDALKDAIKMAEKKWRPQDVNRR